ncbi:hypothetical protein [Deinococcus cellulosilyticus]|uniref:Uncharacterized protein n=1 Tax=Deinococcus cellulosilyticus (strain DSM 18568 / NBRC 106333 / KACC 11606 / 5516J-15) TaxID=1223518 RepID=A0A511N7X5_DEIC1|nr:hypothetical protein [Deinococcus cellulosilyticus]GEM48939.1 hypothetical protein DC3_45740 [Deinococcus cellulosilyticus NBRC 106333 = KACC 11606]
MKHDHLPTHHVYQATDALMFQIRQISDLTSEFGAGASGFQAAELLVAGRRFLCTLQEEELKTSLREHPHVLIQSILDELARQGNHMILVLHHKNDDTYGWKCLLPRIKIFEVTDLLNTAGLELDTPPIHHRS